MFRRVVVSSLVGAGLLLVGVGFAADPAFRFITINFPGAIATAAIGINPSGDIVGNYRDAANVTHGFLSPHNGSPVRLDVPDWFAGAPVIYTDARGINPSGDIVGVYFVEGENPNVAGHGYLRQRDGTFVRVHHPGHLNEYLQRILPDGSILGCYHDNDTMLSMYGTAFSRGAWADLSVAISMTNGATPDLSQQTGWLFDMTATPPRSRAFLLQNETLMPFDYPGASTTSAWDMNPMGAIVGIYRIGTDPFHGFLLERGDFTSIEFPGVGITNSRAFGINARGDIVGSYTDATNSSQAQGFLATRIAGRGPR
jgi:uncharacterized membrane protein